jgi:hypothetical protein
MNSQGNLGNEAVHILVVEDSPTQALQLQHSLEPHDYHVWRRHSRRWSRSRSMKRSAGGPWPRRRAEI